MAMIRRIESLLRRLQTKGLASVRSEMVNSEPVFILSTGRTGTKFFESFLNGFQETVICYHEPKPDFFQLSMKKIRSHVSNVPEKILRGRFRHFSETIAKNKTYVESNPFLSYMINDLLIAFPKSKIIWITRDPATYVVSAFSKSPTGSNDMYFYADNDHRNRISAIDVADPRWASCWPNMDRFEKICWYWNHCNKTIYHDTQKLSEKDLLRIRYEDIFGPERLPHLVNIAKFVGLETHNICIENTVEKINTNPTEFLPAAAEWSIDQKASFSCLTQEMRTRLGYSAIK